MAGEGRPERDWTFVTNHFVVLLCIAENSDVRMSEVAARVGVTERAVQRLVADLVEAGYLVRSRRGRRNHYTIDTTMPLRHLETQHRQLGELLALLRHGEAAGGGGAGQASV
jgi:predicted DNA-binding transcriptional regulator YafY